MLKLIRMGVMPLLLSCLFIAFGGCSRPTANFQLSPIDAEKLDPILVDLRLGYDLVASLTTQMRVTIEEKGEKEEIREYLWYKRSDEGEDQLHIQAMGPYNEPRVIAIAAQKRFLLYFVNEGEAYFEPLADGVLGEIFGVDLRVSDVRNAIFANPFLDGRTEKLSLVQAGSRYIVRRPGVEKDQIEEIEIGFQNDEPVVREWKILAKGETVIQGIKFSDYREVGGILRPHKVEIERPLDRTQVTLRIVNPKINVEISDKKFQFDFLPEHTKFRTIGK